MGKNTVVVEQGYWERDPETGEEEEWRGCEFCGSAEGAEHADDCPFHSSNRGLGLTNVAVEDDTIRYRFGFVHGRGSWEYTNSNIHYNEEAFEYEGTDLRGARWWGASWSECAEKVNDANRVIAKHRQECPEDGWGWGESGDVMTQDADSAGYPAL